MKRKNADNIIKHIKEKPIIGLLLVLGLYVILFIIVGIIAGIEASLVDKSVEKKWLEVFFCRFGDILSKNTSLIIVTPFTVVSFIISIEAFSNSLKSQQFSQKYSLISNLSGYGINEAYIYDIKEFLSPAINIHNPLMPLVKDAIIKALTIRYDNVDDLNNKYFILLKMKAIPSLYLNINIKDMKLWDFGTPIYNKNYSQVILNENEDGIAKQLNIKMGDAIVFSDLYTGKQNSNNEYTCFLLPFECTDDLSKNYFNKLNSQPNVDKYLRCKILFKLQYYDNSNFIIEIEPEWLSINILNKYEKLDVLNNFVG